MASACLMILWRLLCRKRAAGRVRRYYRQQLRHSPASVLVWIMAVHSELVQPLNASVARVRSLFNAAAVDPKVCSGWGGGG